MRAMIVNLRALFEQHNIPGRLYSPQDSLAAVDAELEVVVGPISVHR